MQKLKESMEELRRVKHALQALAKTDKLTPDALEQYLLDHALPVVRRRAFPFLVFLLLLEFLI